MVSFPNDLPRVLFIGSFLERFEQGVIGLWRRR